jgi:hypothetical protein
LIKDTSQKKHGEWRHEVWSGGAVTVACGGEIIIAKGEPRAAHAEEHVLALAWGSRAL